MCVCVCVSSVMSDSLGPHGLNCWAPLSMEFSRQEYWSGSITYSRESSQPRDRTWVSVSCIGRRILYQLFHLEVGRCFSSPFSKLSSKLLLWFIQSLYYLKFWTYLMKHSFKGKWFSPALLIQREGGDISFENKYPTDKNSNSLWISALLKALLHEKILHWRRKSISACRKPKWKHLEGSLAFSRKFTFKAF